MSAKTYRRKTPVTVQAMGPLTPENVEQAEHWVLDALGGLAPVGSTGEGEGAGLWIGSHTFEVHVPFGDYLVKDEVDEFEAVKASDFEEIFEEVGE